MTRHTDHLDLVCAVDRAETHRGKDFRHVKSTNVSGLIGDEPGGKQAKHDLMKLI